MNTNIEAYHFPVGTKQERGLLIPVFLPFAGCPFPCIYCVQDRQSGVGNRGITDALQELDMRIDQVIKKNVGSVSTIKTLEIAFYGGTFTALKEKELTLCLNAFKKHKIRLSEACIKLFGRCSTRPDCLGLNNVSGDKSQLSPVLSLLKEAGINLIELGIQSFNTELLSGIGRGYNSEVAQEACAYIKEQGFELGIQLMPSIPSQSVEDFHKDVELALSYKPSCLRYYPCLVPSGTGLAKLWQAGKFSPWDLNTCVDALGHALCRAWQEKVPVIRLSIAPEKEFDVHVLAGVRHPALGSLIQAQALLYAFDAEKNRQFPQIHKREESDKTKMLGETKQNDTMNLDTMNIDTVNLDVMNLQDESFHLNNPSSSLYNGRPDSPLENLELHVPKNFQGFIFGEKNCLKEEWAKRLPLNNIFFHGANEQEKGKVQNFTTQYAFLSEKQN